MCENENSGTLYWESGPARVCITTCDPTLAQSAIDRAINDLEAFRVKCQELSILFDIIDCGTELWLNQNKSYLEEHPNNVYSFGTQFPNYPQSRGQSTTKSIVMKRLLELLKPNGEGANLVANLFVVSLYHLWEDEYRVYIKKSLSLYDKNLIKCDLMGDIGEVRNDIVHNRAEIKPATVDKLTMLPLIWPIEPGRLLITSPMLHALMEQINAIRIKVETPSSP